MLTQGFSHYFEKPFFNAEILHYFISEQNVCLYCLLKEGVIDSDNIKYRRKNEGVTHTRINNNNG